MRFVLSGFSSGERERTERVVLILSKIVRRRERSKKKPSNHFLRNKYFSNPSKFNSVNFCFRPTDCQWPRLIPVRNRDGTIPRLPEEGRLFAPLMEKARREEGEEGKKERVEEKRKQRMEKRRDERKEDFILVTRGDIFNSSNADCGLNP